MHTLSFFSVAVLKLYLRWRKVSADSVNCSESEALRAPSRIDLSLNPSRASRSASARCGCQGLASPPSYIMFAFLIRRASESVQDYGRLGFKAADLVLTAVSGGGIRLAHRPKSSGCSYCPSVESSSCSSCRHCWEDWAGVQYLGGRTTYLK